MKKEIWTYGKRNGRAAEGIDDNGNTWFGTGRLLIRGNPSCRMPSNSIKLSTQQLGLMLLRGDVEIIHSKYVATEFAAAQVNLPFNTSAGSVIRIYQTVKRDRIVKRDRTGFLVAEFENDNGDVAAFVDALRFVILKEEFPDAEYWLNGGIISSVIDGETVGLVAVEPKAK